jgi:hypothetical protein
VYAYVNPPPGRLSEAGRVVLAGAAQPPHGPITGATATAVIVLLVVMAVLAIARKPGVMAAVAVGGGAALVVSSLTGGWPL